MDQFRSSRNELELFTWHCNYKLNNRCPHYVMGRLSLLHGVPSRYIHVHVYIYTLYELTLNLFRTVVFKSYIQQFPREMPTAQRVDRVKCVKWFHYECKMLFFCNSPVEGSTELSWFSVVCRCSCRFLNVFYGFFFSFSSFSPVHFGQFQSNLAQSDNLGRKGIHFCLRKGLRPFRGGDDSSIIVLHNSWKRTAFKNLLQNRVQWSTLNQTWHRVL